MSTTAQATAEAMHHSLANRLARAAPRRSPRPDLWATSSAYPRAIAPVTGNSSTHIRACQK
jgi:hypothetical protein